MSAGVKRLLAFVFAAALVAGSLAIRHSRSDDHASSRRDDQHGFRLLCASDLRDVCNMAFKDDKGIELEFEDPGKTVDRLTKKKKAGDPGFDGWLTAGPWHEILADNRRFAGARGELLGGTTGVLARSPVVIATVSTAAQAQVAEACGPSVGWACLVEHVEGSGEGSIRIGVPNPDRGDGLAVLASATNAFASSVLNISDYSSQDLEVGEFSTYIEDLTSVAKGIRIGNRTVLETAIGQHGSFSVVGTVEAELAVLTNRPKGLAVIYPQPLVTADVRLSTSTGTKPEKALEQLGSDRLAAALATAGWRVEGHPAPQGASSAPELPTNSNLPSPGVLQGLREVWGD